MKLLLNIILIGIIAFGLNACKSSQESTDNGENAKIEAKSPKTGEQFRGKPGISPRTQQSGNEGITKEEINNEANKLNQEETYRVIISFISWGEGVDPNARKILDSYITEMQENTEKEVVFETMPWGREGEADFCFTLTDFDDEDQLDFIKNLKAAFSDNKLVQIYENSPAIHKR